MGGKPQWFTVMYAVTGSYVSNRQNARLSIFRESPPSGVYATTSKDRVRQCRAHSVKCYEKDILDFIRHVFVDLGDDR